MKNLVVFILGAIALSSCGGPKMKTVDASTVLIDSITLNYVNNEPGSLHFYLINKKTYLEYMGRKKQVIYLTSITDNVADSVPLPNVFKDVQIDFYVDEHKKVFIMEKNSNIICAFTDTAHITKYKYHEDTAIRTKLYAFSTFQITDNKVMLNVIPYYRIYDPAERKKYFESKAVGLFKLEHDSIVELNKFIAFPKEYKHDLFGDLFPTYCINRQDTLVYAFNNSATIYVQNIHSTAIIEHKNTGVEVSPLSHFDIDSMQDISYDTRYGLLNDQFGGMVYDERSKNYAVIQTLKIPEKRSDGLLSIFEDKPVLITILDPSFHAIKKILFKRQGTAQFVRTFYDNGILYIPEFTKTHSNKIYEYKVN